MFKRIFYTERVKLFESLLDARAQLKENSATKIRLKNTTVCVLLNQETIYVFQAKCPHNGASLVGVKCQLDKSIVCPLHRYVFSLTNGQAIANACSPIKMYKVIVDKDEIFVELVKRKLAFF